jgi:ferritin-like metal-binding protein YciE
VTETIQEKVVEYIQDAHAMEQSVLQMLDSLISTTNDAQMKADLELHRQQTERQVERLRQRLEELDEGTSALKDTGARMSAMPKGLFDRVRGDQPGRNARDAYVTEHLEIAAYQLLERVAERAGDSRTAEIARQNRAEEEEMARRIDAMWDRVVELTLQEEGIAVRQ